MTVYPQAIDDDRSIIRIDDLISELGTAAINQLRSAVFAIEKELGITPSGSMSSLGSRISVSLNKDGTLRTEAIEAAGFVALPIVDKYIANNAGIKEYKLDLDVSTLDLQAQIDAIDIVANNTASLAAETNADLLNHIAGVALLADGITRARHYDNQIDLSFTLYDKDGNALTAIQLAQALYQINQLLINHQNTIYDAHPATAITVFSQDWNELPADAENLQEVLDFLDNRETLSTGVDRATLNSNGIPRNARVQRIDLDGYNYEIIPETKCRAYLAELNQTGPRDSITNGDDVISFIPEGNSDFSFDTKFTQVQVGDILRINYGNGIAGEYRVSSLRLTPGVEWVVRIDGWNLVNRDGNDGYAYARIDRRRHDINTNGILAVAGAHADVVPDGSCSTSLDSVIVASPRGAMAIGIGFDPGAFNEKHYNLWLRLYPTGKPDIHTDLYPIDVTGNEGTTPGAYSLETIVETTNRAFRAAGNNYRFIAFQHKGEFGIMLADSWRNAAFTIITGQAASTVVEEGIYTNNVIGDAIDGYDALGFGSRKAIVASPVTSGYTAALEAVNMPTIIHSPIKGRDYMVNGSRRDFLRTKNYTNGDGYWHATIISNFSDIPNGTITTTYRINKALFAEELTPGKTIVVQSVNSSDTNITGYGRFIIGDVLYNEITDKTDILVINSVHSGGNPLGGTLSENTNVLIYFTEDSVGFNTYNLAAQGTFHRYHEIFVEQYGRTHAVERARMEKQSTDVYKLNTDRDHWQIRNVSSKLKGYRLDDNLRFWVRFYIINYNTTTGEFDGYLGSPPNIGTGWETTPGIIRNGPLVRGTKNIPVRFYDETNVNFIDIEFRELATTPGTIITSSPQYIDIEIFQTFVENEEVFRLAGVSHNETTIGSITDLREFGTISEENFTDSAVRFIESGERYLHANGIVRGFEYTGTGNNDAILQISGGIGLINGSFVAMSAMDVIIPEMRGSTPSFNLFLCATQNGTFRLIPENVGSQFFQTLTGEFVESYTFSDIIDNHKDLLILYVINVTVDAGTELEPETGYLILNSVTDARRFVYNEDLNSISLSISAINQPKPNNASFHSFESLTTWVNKYGIQEVHIGDIVIDDGINHLFNPNTQVVLTGGSITITNGSLEFRKVTLEKTYILNTVAEGFKFGSNFDLINSIVDYNPNITVSNYVGADSGGSFITDGSQSDIRFIDNIFRSNDSSRPPFITFRMVNYPDADIISDVIIKNNVTYSMNSLMYCAVCIEALGGTSAVGPTTLRNVKISDNNFGSNTIFIASRTATSGLNMYGHQMYNVKISGNICSGIGYFSSATSSTIKNTNLEICENVFNYLFPAKTVSPYVNISTITSVGNVHIHHNTINGIVHLLPSSRTGIPCHVTFDHNDVFFESNVIFRTLNAGVDTYIAFEASSDVFSDTKNSYLTIDNNVLRIVADTPVSLGWRNLLVTNTNITCTNNVMEIDSSVSVYASSFCFLFMASQTIYRNVFDVSGNKFIRNSISIYRYISAINGEGYIIDNWFNSPLTDNSNPTSWLNAIYVTDLIITTRNKNHWLQKTYNLGQCNFVFIEHQPYGNTPSSWISIDQLPNVTTSSPTSYAGLLSQSYLYQLNISSGDSCIFQTMISLDTMLPSDSKLVSVNVGVSVVNKSFWTGTLPPPLSGNSRIEIYGRRRSGTSTVNYDTFDATTTDSETLNIDFNSEASSNLYMIIYHYMVRDSAYSLPTYFQVNSIEAVYTW